MEQSKESLELALYRSQLFEEKVKHDDYADRFYNTLCNQRFEHKESKDRDSFSFRAAGDVLATMRKKTHQGEDYLTFYPPSTPSLKDSEVLQDLEELGWMACEYEDY